MHRNLLVLGLFASGCVPAKARVATAPTSTPAACSKESSPPLSYLIDGKSATCATAMSLPASRIASIEVVKGPAAVSLYGPSAAAGVVVIQTKQDR